MSRLAGLVEEEPKSRLSGLLESQLPPDPREEEKQIGETLNLSEKYGIPISDGMKFTAAPEPSLFGKILNDVKQRIRERTGYFEPPIYGKKYREEQPLRTAGKMAAYYGAEYISGRTGTALDILAAKTKGDKSLADSMARITDFEPTPEEAHRGVMLKYLGLFKPVSTGVRGLTGLISPKALPSQTLRMMLNSGLTFSSVDAAIQTSKHITEGTPIDWSQIHLSGGIGVLFGSVEALLGKGIEKWTADRLTKEYYRTMPQLKEIPKKELKNIAQAAIDSHKVKAGLMDSDIWLNKHSNNLYDFSEKLKNLGRKPDVFLLPKHKVPPEIATSVAKTVAKETGTVTPEGSAWLTEITNKINKGIPVTAPEKAFMEKVRDVYIPEKGELAAMQKPAGEAIEAPQPPAEPTKAAEPTVEGVVVTKEDFIKQHYSPQADAIDWKGNWAEEGPPGLHYEQEVGIGGNAGIVFRDKQGSVVGSIRWFIDEQGKPYAVYPKNQVDAELRETTLWVDPNYRRRGIGTKLIEKAQEQGIDPFITTSATKEGAELLYKIAQKQGIIAPPAEAKPEQKRMLPETEGAYGMEGFEERQKSREQLAKHIGEQKEQLFSKLSKSSQTQLETKWSKKRYIWAEGTKSRREVIEDSITNPDIIIVIETKEKDVHPEKLLSGETKTVTDTYLKVDLGYGKSRKITLTKAEQQYAQLLKQESEKWAQEALGKEAKPETAKQPWEMTDKEFKEGGWAEFESIEGSPYDIEGQEISAILLPSEYKQIAKNEGEQARDLVYELNRNNVITIDAHKTKEGIVIHIPPDQLDAAQEFIKKHDADVRTEKIGHYLMVKSEKLAQEALEKAKPKKEAGFIEIEKTVNAMKAPARWFLSIFEPQKITARKHGKEAVATVMRAIHKPEAKALEYGAKEIESLDKNYNQAEEWLGKYPKEIQEAIMLTRGHGLEGKARALQKKAFASLPKELKDSKVRRALDEIADFNYEYLSEVFGEEIETLFGTDIVGQPGYVQDYFYGVYKNPTQINKFLSFWKTTDKYTKHKVFPTYADAKAYGLEIKDPNPVTNLKAEYKAISYKASMTWLKDELMRLGEGRYIMPKEEAPADWETIGAKGYAEPTFSDVLLEPDMAKLINSLIATNKISQFKPTRALRDTNNFLRAMKFIGSAFHMVQIAKQSIADSGYLGFYKPTARRGFTLGFKKDDPMFQTPEYKWYIENGGGHQYAVESQARKVFSDTLSKLTESEQYVVKIATTPIRLPVGFVDWMFNSYIPKVKYAKYLDWVAVQEKKLGRPLTAAETQEIIKEQQNFYGMMNERLFGRSGTVTSSMRFAFIAPSYAIGNYRTQVKAAFQWGQGEEGFSASRSRSNIINSWIITATAATVGTLILTGKPPKKPETLEEMRDLLKIDTGKKDANSQKIMIDLATYDRDYWDMFFNTLRGRPDIAADNAIKRIGGMKAPTAKMISDLYAMMQGKTLYDWKEDKVYHITDPFLQKVGKLITHEVKELIPISASVYKQSRQRGIDRATAAIETLLGFRPGRTERDKKEFEIVRDIWDMRDKREALSYRLNNYDDPWKAIELYNKTLDGIADNKFITDELREKLNELKIDPEKVITWKRFPIERLTEEQIKLSIQEHVYRRFYKDDKGVKHKKGSAHKGWEDRVEAMRKELEKRTGSREFRRIRK